MLFGPILYHRIRIVGIGFSLVGIEVSSSELEISKDCAEIGMRLSATINLFGSKIASFYVSIVLGV